MNRKDKLYLASAGSMGGVGFTVLAFHFNQKNILNESLYVWSAVFLGCLVFCLLAILKRDL